MTVEDEFHTQNMHKSFILTHLKRKGVLRDIKLDLRVY